MLKNYILSHCLTKNNTLNNRVCVESWWKVRDYSIYTSILNQTSFLDKYKPEFSERLFTVINDTVERPICQVCNSNTTNFKSFKDGYYTYCSKFCSTQSKERNKKISENTDHVAKIEKMKQTNLIRYGVLYATQTKNVVEKTKISKLNRYGSEKYNNIEKAKRTNQIKYGVDYSCSNTDIILKMQENKKIIYPELRNRDWLIEKNKTKSITEIAVELNCSYRTVYMHYINNNIPINFYSPDFSKQQTELSDYIKSIYSGKILINDRNAIKPKELDIYLPEINLAIEYNGMFWHSEDKNRHINKHNLCKDKNIQLLQFWDHEWIEKKEIVKSIIASKLKLSKKIYARKCKIINLSSKQYNEFIEFNHIQGSVNSSIRYGLTHNDELVCAMGIGKSRFNKKYTHELLRFCNKLNTTVVGGFDKLLKHSIKNETISSLQTFADIRLFSGSVYEKSNFTFSHNTPPGFVYYNKGVVKNRQEFQKHKLKNIFNNFDPELSEQENTLRNGWLRVYDCGQSCYFL